MSKSLDEVKVGYRGRVMKLNAESGFRQRLLDMGLTPGVELYIERVAPLGSPIEVRVRGYHLSLRKEEAACIIVSDASEEKYDTTNSH